MVPILPSLVRLPWVWDDAALPSRAVCKFVTSEIGCVCADGTKVAGLPVSEFQSTGGETAATAVAKSVMLAATCVWLDGGKVAGFPLTLSHAMLPDTSPGGPCWPCGPAGPCGPCGPTNGKVTLTDCGEGKPTETACELRTTSTL